MLLIFNPWKPLCWNNCTGSFFVLVLFGSITVTLCLISSLSQISLICRKEDRVFRWREAFLVDGSWVSCCRLSGLVCPCAAREVWGQTLRGKLPFATCFRVILVFKFELCEIILVRQPAIFVCQLLATGRDTVVWLHVFRVAFEASQYICTNFSLC